MKASRARRFALLAAAVALPVGITGWLQDWGRADAKAPARPAAGAAVAAASPTPVAASAPASAPAPASTPVMREALARLDTRLIEQRSATSAPGPDAFVVRSWAPPPPPPVPAPAPPPPPPPPPPQAPPLPFKYWGKLDESAERTVWYLGRGEQLLVVGTGDVIDDTYRVDGVEGGNLRFTYLPLGTQQALPLGKAP